MDEPRVTPLSAPVELGTRRAHRSTTHRGAFCTAVLMAAGLVLAPPARAAEHSNRSTAPTAVLDWNAYALDALVTRTIGPPSAPTAASLHLAMVHLAIDEAVTSIDKRHRRTDDRQGRVSRAAAVAQAAHDVLVTGVKPALTPAIVTDLDGLLLGSLAQATQQDGATAAAAGSEVGAQAAASIVESRADDGRTGPFRFAGSEDIGKWRPGVTGTDPNAWVAFVTPFTLKSPAQFQTRGPDRLTSPAYARDYNEIKAVGAADTPGAEPHRTVEQEAVAQFYNVHPVELFNRTLRTIAADRHLSLAAQSKLFALANTATADSNITCWYDKTRWYFWRPLTAIQNGDQDGNPRTSALQGWSPQLITPPYPDHPSGYNCMSAAMMYAARAFFGTNRVEFDVVRKDPAPPGQPGKPDVTRHYSKFTDVVDDTIDARVFQGIHFRNADIQGAEIGENVARWVSRQYR